MIPAEEDKVSVLAKKMTQGRLDQPRPAASTSCSAASLALWLGVGVGDNVVVTTNFQATPMGAVPQLKRFTVSGIFEAGYQEYDKGLAVANFQDLQRVLRMGDAATGVRCACTTWTSRSKSRATSPCACGPYRVTDWQQDNANMFRALKLEKTMMAILLSLIIAMGAFNPRVLAGDAGHRQAGGHSDPAHARADAGRGDEGVHGAGFADQGSSAPLPAWSAASCSRSTSSASCA